MSRAGFPIRVSRWVKRQEKKPHKYFCDNCFKTFRTGKFSRFDDAIYDDVCPYCGNIGLRIEDVELNKPSVKVRLFDGDFDSLDFLTTVLRGIKDELDRVMWNNTQKEYDSPFGNTGNTYKNDVFEVKAYNWGDDGNDWNFKYKDIEVSWYKYLGRGMCINRDVTLDEVYEMYQDCVKSVRREDEC